jgi:hypothetical protein
LITQSQPPIARNRKYGSRRGNGEWSHPEDRSAQSARNGNTTLRDAAIASGAQFVSTDYPAPDPDFGTGYFVEIPGGMPAGCNPIGAPPECMAADIENLTVLADSF